jgi:hypothetical protein
VDGKMMMKKNKKKKVREKEREKNWIKIPTENLNKLVVFQVLNSHVMQSF